MRGACRLKHWLTVILVVAVSGSAAVAQHGGRKRVEKAEIEDLQEQWRQAQLGDNVTAMDHLLADDFLGVTAAGQVVTKLQQLDRMRTRQLNITQLDISDSKIKFSHTLAVVTSLVHLDGTADGHPLRGYFRFVQVFQKSPGDGWKITTFEATRVRNSQQMNDTSSTVPAVGSATRPATVPSSAPASPAGPASPQPRS